MNITISVTVEVDDDVSDQQVLDEVENSIVNNAVYDDQSVIKMGKFNVAFGDE